MTYKMSYKSCKISRGHPISGDQSNKSASSVNNMSMAMSNVTTVNTDILAVIFYDSLTDFTALVALGVNVRADESFQNR